MWNRRRDEEPVRPQATSPTTPEPAREGIPMSTMPARSYEPEAPRATATIGKSVYVKGSILSREDLVIDGQVDGNVEAQENRVTIGPNGRVNANIKARDVVVTGQLKVSIEEGADLKGSLDMIRVEAKAEAAAETPKAAEKPTQQTLSASASAADGKR
jgi:hypothetical protein